MSLVGLHAYQVSLELNWLKPIHTQKWSKIMCTPPIPLTPTLKEIKALDRLWEVFVTFKACKLVHYFYLKSCQVISFFIGMVFLNDQARVTSVSAWTRCVHLNHWNHLHTICLPQTGSSPATFHVYQPCDWCLFWHKKQLHLQAAWNINVIDQLPCNHTQKC